MRPAVLPALVALASCGPAVKQVEVAPARLVLESAGASAELKATPRDFAGAALPLRVSWSSARPEVAEVDASGRVTARRSGEAEVRAAVAGQSATVPVRVSIPARATLAPAALALTGVPATGTLALELADETGREIAPGEVAWKSTDEGVVRVAGGTVTAVAPGQARVTASAAGLTATAAVEVKLPPFAALKLAPARLSLAPGATGRVAASAVDASGMPVAGVPVRYASSDERVARVAADGTVTAVRRGKARITASGGGRSAAAEVTVRR